MKKEWFKLFGVHRSKETKDERHDQVQALRKQARSHQEANNALVSKIWDIDLKLVMPDLAEDKRQQLQEERNKLSQQMDEEGHAQKHKDLLQQIRKLESEIKGQSNIGRHSPHEL